MGGVQLLWLAVATPVVINASSEYKFLRTAAEKAECEKNPGPWCDYPAERRVWHWPPWWALALEVAVPLMLLGLGATTYWVAMGFKPAKLRRGNSRVGDIFPALGAQPFTAPISSPRVM